ncbi:hypothetical protein RN001_007922 [Aquatica leii]|uniref:Nucleoporin Nup159/Nup146 N-terminal domain-containing protein n=1 Tax=Aquatica leii TaxID=1421715 RepID=A0AAN7PCM8_9COLE|nr:hypothetical protein RN001_007922 [Aquatica leii]
MTKPAPNPIDIQDFQFKLHCRLKVFSNDNNDSFKKPCHILTSASCFGLIFVGTTSPAFKVIRISDIEILVHKENDEADYKCRTVPLTSIPIQLSVNCDSTKLAVVVEKNGCMVAIIYDVLSFFRKDISIVQEVRLSTSPGVDVVETTWNPTLPNVFTACKSDGTLGVYEFKETGIDINELPAESQASCMCWSPKGKQIAVGSANGKITQYKPDLKAMKVINAPPLDGSYSVVAIQWISSFQFIAVYKCTSSDAGSTLLVIDAPKTGDVTYTNYEDICYSCGNTRPVQFYTIHEPLWNILLVASSNSMEVGVLGNEKEQWTQWILTDSARAELPLSSSKQDTLPVGLTLDKSAVEPVIWGEHSLPPAPFLFLLSHYGVLCCFRVINIKNGVLNICQTPKPLSDVSGLNMFVSTAKLTPNVQTVTAEVSKPVPPPQISQAVLTPPKEVPPPPKDLSFNPQASLFASSAASSFFGTTTESTTKPNISTKTAPIKLETQQTLVTPKVQSPSSILTTTIASSVHSVETKIDQEETDILISKLIREECEALEKELKLLLYKGNSVKVELGTDGEAVKVVQDTDSIQSFLTEVIETSTVQAAEVHSLKQGLVQTWAWYEDARSRYLQIQDSTLDTLFRIQQLDPVSQRYMNDIQYLTYYLESQLLQAGKVLDEQWECFQDSCKKISRLKIPTVETIYQTMVRQTAIHQKQKYVLKDISSRIRAQRSKVNGRSLFVSLNNVEQLQKDLLQLQLDPSNILCAQFDRVLETHQKFTSSKIKKLEKILSEKEITHISVNKPQLSNTSLYTLLNNSASQSRRVENDATHLGAALSPISANKTVPAAPRIINFVQSTPMTAVTIPAKTEKLTTNFDNTSLVKSVPTSIFANIDVSKAQEDKASFDFTANIKKNFTFTSKPNTVMNENKLTAPQTNNSLTSKPETTFSFAISTGPVSVPASTVASLLPVGFESVTTPSFTSIFGSSKPSTSTTKITPSVTVTSGTEINKSISSTASSAFVPTTQLAFTFTAKCNPTATPSTTNLATKPSSTAFSFIASSSETPQTPTFLKADPFASNTVKNIVSPKPSLSTLSSDSTSSTTSFFKATSTNPSTTTISSSKTFTNVFPSITTTSATTPTQSLSSDKLVNLFGTTSAFSFSNTDSQSSVFTFKTSTLQDNQNSNSQSSLSSPTTIFAPVTKTTSQATIFGSTSKPAFSSENTTTASNSVFSPVTTSGTATLSTYAEADSTNTSKSESLFITPTTTTTSSTSVFGGLINTSTTGSANVTTTGTLLFGTTTITTTVSSVFGNASTPKSIFGTANSNIFENKTTVASAPSVSESGVNSTTTSTVNIFGNKVATIASSTPIIFGSTVITTTPPVSSLIGSTAAVTTTSAPSVFGTTSVAATTTAPTSSLFGIKTIPPVTSGSTIFGGSAAVTTTTTSLFGVVVSTSSLQTQLTNTPAATTTTTLSASTFGVPPTTSPLFGTLPTTTSTPIFGSVPGFGTTTTSIFGQPTTTASLFSTPKSSVFGEPVKTSSGPFGGQTNAFESTPSVFGAAPVFGTPVTTAGNIFGSTNSTTSTFGAGGSIFGGAATTNTGFPQTPTSSFSFSAAAANIPNTGFSKPAFGFGASQGSADGGSFSFNNLNMGASTTTPNASFGQSPSANPFAKSSTQDQKPFGGGSLFGTPSSTTASIFGGGSSSVFGNANTQPSQAFGMNPGFGANPTFGQSPAFGQSTFGSSFGSPQQATSFSGGTGQSVAQTGFGGFGQAQQKSPGFGSAPVFGGSPTGFGAPPSFGGTATTGFGASPAFGSPGKVFGEPANTTGFSTATQQNSTFANLATQNTIGFGALAQQSPTLPAAAPFQSSSFSTWR